MARGLRQFSSRRKDGRKCKTIIIPDEFDFIEKVIIRHRLIIIASYLLFICFFKLILGYKNPFFYLISGLYILYLLIIELVKFPKDAFDSNLFRAFRVGLNILFASILVYLGDAAFEFYVLLIPWVIASSILFSKMVSLLITSMIATIYIGISSITFETILKNIHFSSSVVKTLGLFGVWLLSGWWWERRMLSQKRKNRLQVLHELQIKAMHLSIKELCKKVVELTYDQLNSEESALFLQDAKKPDYIVKVALKAPFPEIESKLSQEESKYKIGESLTGMVFQSKESIISPNVEEDPRANKENVEKYCKVIPSGRILHYVGVPLIIEDEVLGVLRGINKKSPKYSVDKKNFQFSKKGFDEEDRILLEIIAREVAITIKNAKNKNYLDHLVDNTDEAVIALDQRGIIQKFNKSAERIFGYKAKEVIDTDVRKHYKDAEEALRIMKLLKDSDERRISNVEAFVKAKDGEIIPIDLSACLLYDETGEMLGSLGLFRDLRVLKALQDKVIQTERMAAMGVIARSVGHELKHDFNSIILFAEALNRLVGKDKKASETAHKIINVSEKGTNKLNKMLKAVRPQPPEKKGWSVKYLFEDITAELREKSELKGITFNVQYKGHLMRIEVDSRQIKEVLENLFSNSLDSTEKGGEIKLSLEQKEGKLLICWENTGESISEKDIPKIFDPFFTTKKSGSGLGLSLVQMIIINHGGRIWVDPEFQKGARFYIELPISEHQK